jgi:3-methyladenine DNA glycosylase AlkD
MDSLEIFRKDLKKKSSKAKSKIYQNFFKTGKGQYGEGDVFLGITVPDSRIIAKKFNSLDIYSINELLDSKIHEERLIALLILVHNYQKGNEEQKYQILNHYLKNTKKINNWDLVDLTADKILGEYLLDKPKDIIYQLARSDNLWEKRISIISTFHFIKNNQFQDTLDIAEILLFDSHDLIHKAVGWMLREVGNRDIKTEEAFLKRHYKKMPRTMLRYAIEKFPERKRQRYLKGKI